MRPSRQLVHPNLDHLRHQARVRSQQVKQATEMAMSPTIVVGEFPSEPPPLTEVCWYIVDQSKDSQTETDSRGPSVRSTPDKTACTETRILSSNNDSESQSVEANASLDNASNDLEDDGDLIIYSSLATNQMDNDNSEDNDNGNDHYTNYVSSSSMNSDDILEIPNLAASPTLVYDFIQTEAERCQQDQADNITKKQHGNHCKDINNSDITISSSSSLSSTCLKSPSQCNPDINHLNNNVCSVSNTHTNNNKCDNDDDRYHRYNDLYGDLLPTEIVKCGPTTRFVFSNIDRYDRLRAPQSPSLSLYVHPSKSIPAIKSQETLSLSLSSSSSSSFLEIPIAKKPLEGHYSTLATTKNINPTIDGTQNKTLHQSITKGIDDSNQRYKLLPSFSMRKRSAAMMTATDDAEVPQHAIHVTKPWDSSHIPLSPTSPPSSPSSKGDKGKIRLPAISRAALRQVNAEYENKNNIIVGSLSSLSMSSSSLSFSSLSSSSFYTKDNTTSSNASSKTLTTLPVAQKRSRVMDENSCNIVSKESNTRTKGGGHTHL